jgi:hypothetical protein
MSKEFTVSNFTYSDPTVTIPDDQIFELHITRPRLGKGTSELFGTATWQELKSGFTIIVDDDVCMLTIKGRINNKLYEYELPVKICPQSNRSEDCFSFTFMAPIDNPEVSIGLIHSNTYNFDIWWGDEGEGDTAETINVGTLAWLNNDNHSCSHKYNMAAGETRIISICGTCTRLTLINNGFAGGIWYYDSLIHPKTPLPVIAINNWGNVDMTSFKDFAKQSTLWTIPEGPIPHPVGNIDDVDTCFESMFEDCHYLKKLNCNNLFSNFPEVRSFKSTFENCDKIDLPFDIFSGCISATEFINTFKNCHNLKPSRYTIGGTYYEDRIYHNGEPGYPSPTNNNQEFANTYLNCNGRGSFPVPYWSVFPNYDHGSGIADYGFENCYKGMDFKYYTQTSTASPEILNDYKSDHEGWFI